MRRADKKVQGQSDNEDERKADKKVEIEADNEVKKKADKEVGRARQANSWPTSILKDSFEMLRRVVRSLIS